MQCFSLIRNIGEGVGSGLGSFILEHLADDYHRIVKLDNVVYSDDSNILSPYNSVLAMKDISEHSDLVIPIDKEFIAEKISNKLPLIERFEILNNILANFYKDLTSPFRYPGFTNLTIREMCENLVPFSDLQYVVPNYLYVDSTTEHEIDCNQSFRDILGERYQFLKFNPKNSVRLAQLFVCRGNVSVFEVDNSIKMIKSGLKMIVWNRDGVKFAIPNEQSPDSKLSLVSMSNTNSINEHFNSLKQKFLRLHKNRSHIQSYLKHMDSELFNLSLESLEELMSRYDKIIIPKDTKQDRIKMMI